MCVPYRVSVLCFCPGKIKDNLQNNLTHRARLLSPLSYRHQRDFKGIRFNFVMTKFIMAKIHGKLGQNWCCCLSQYLLCRSYLSPCVCVCVFNWNHFFLMTHAIYSLLRNISSSPSFPPSSFSSLYLCAIGNLFYLQICLGLIGHFRQFLVSSSFVS